MAGIRREGAPLVPTLSLIREVVGIEVDNALATARDLEEDDRRGRLGIGSGERDKLCCLRLEVLVEAARRGKVRDLRDGEIESIFGEGERDRPRLGPGLAIGSRRLLLRLGRREEEAKGSFDARLLLEAESSPVPSSSSTDANTPSTAFFFNARAALSAGSITALGGPSAASTFSLAIIAGLAGAPILGRKARLEAKNDLLFFGCSADVVVLVAGMMRGVLPCEASRLREGGEAAKG